MFTTYLLIVSVCCLMLHRELKTDVCCCYKTMTKHWETSKTDTLCYKKQTRSMKILKSSAGKQLEEWSRWKFCLWLLIWASSFTLRIMISPAADVWRHLGNIIQKRTAEKQTENTGGKRGSSATKVSCESRTGAVVVGWYVSGTRMWQWGSSFEWKHRADFSPVSVCSLLKGLACN